MAYSGQSRMEGLNLQIWKKNSREVKAIYRLDKIKSHSLCDTHHPMNTSSTK